MIEAWITTSGMFRKKLYQRNLLYDRDNIRASDLPPVNYSAVQVRNLSDKIRRRVRRSLSKDQVYPGRGGNADSIV